MKTIKTEKRMVEVDVEVPTVDNIGPYDSFLGKNGVLVICVNYIYFGDCVAVNGSILELENPYLVYNTGSWAKAPNWQDVQKLPTKKLKVALTAIETAFVVNDYN